MAWYSDAISEHNFLEMKKRTLNASKRKTTDTRVCTNQSNVRSKREKKQITNRKYMIVY